MASQTLRTVSSAIAKDRIALLSTSKATDLDRETQLDNKAALREKSLASLIGCSITFAWRHVTLEEI